MALLLLIVAPTQLALAVDFRVRIAVAFAVASLLLLLGREKPSLLTGRVSRLVQLLAKTSYSVFLVHFPVCLVVNAAFSRSVMAEPSLQCMGVLVAWVASSLAGIFFFQFMELPLSRFVALLPTPRDAQLLIAITDR